MLNYYCQVLEICNPPPATGTADQGPFLFMVFFNYATMQMAAKIVYYGPGLCGKTTNLQYIYQKTSPKSRGEMVSLETETDRTLFFDLLPLDVGNIAGFKTRFQLYTVPGQVFYNSTRKLVLRGVDGIVFVADSQMAMMEANVESMHNLMENLEQLGIKALEVPMVLQYNKRDLKNVIPVDEMNRVINQRGLPYYEASAVQGVGVFETLKGISRATLITVRKKALGEEKPKVPDAATKPMDKPATVAPPPAAPPEPPPLEPPITFNELEMSGPHEKQDTSPMSTVKPVVASEAVHLVPTPVESPNPEVPEPEKVAPPPDRMPTAAEIAKENVEFSEILSQLTKPTVKKIAVKNSDVALKLDALREMYTGKIVRETTKPADDKTNDALNALVESARPKEKKVTKKLKIRLEPDEIEAIQDLMVDFHLIGSSGIHKRFSNAVNVSVEGKSNPKRVVLEIRIEIVKK